MPTRQFSLAQLIRVIGLLALVVVFAGCSLNTPEGEEDAITISGAPVVRLVSPQPNATYLEGVSVNIQALVTNAGADIDRVEVSVDNVIVATLTDPNTTESPQFSIAHTWTSAGVGAHSVTVSAFRADGSSSDPASANVNVVAQGAQVTQPTTAPNPGGDNPATEATTSGGNTQTQATQRATMTPRPPTNTPQNQEPTTPPTDTPPPTPSVPMAVFAQGINVRRGPGTNFEPPIGAFAAGQEVEILAVNPGASWYKVRYYNTDGWVFAQLATLNGDISSLPVEAGPPTPVPATATPIPPTAVPATAVPQTAANLVAGIAVLDPAQPRCGETFVVGFDVANLGTQATSGSGTVSLRDVRAADGSTQGETQGGFPIIEPNQTFRVTMPITISTWHSDDHRIILSIDPSNQIPETNESDNVREITYRLDKGNCP